MHIGSHERVKLGHHALIGVGEGLITVAVLYVVAEGMRKTGGMAFVYDATEDFEIRVNPDSVIWQRIETEHWDELCRALIERHVEETQSRWADRILRNWDTEKRNFWQVVPKEMLNRLEHPVSAAGESAKIA